MKLHNRNLLELNHSIPLSCNFERSIVIANHSLKGYLHSWYGLTVILVVCYIYDWKKCFLNISSNGKFLILKMIYALFYRKKQAVRGQQMHIRFNFNQDFKKKKINQCTCGKKHVPPLKTHYVLRKTNI